MSPSGGGYHQKMMVKEQGNKWCSREYFFLITEISLKQNALNWCVPPHRYELLKIKYPVTNWTLLPWLTLCISIFMGPIYYINQRKGEIFVSIIKHNFSGMIVCTTERQYYYHYFLLVCVNKHSHLWILVGVWLRDWIIKHTCFPENFK